MLCLYGIILIFYDNIIYNFHQYFQEHQDSLYETLLEQRRRPLRTTDQRKDCDCRQFIHENILFGGDFYIIYCHRIIHEQTMYNLIFQIQISSNVVHRRLSSVESLFQLATIAVLPLVCGSQWPPPLFMNIFFALGINI